MNHSFLASKATLGRTGTDNRLFLEAILRLARTASPWRDLPPKPGNWRTAHCRVRRWTQTGVWEDLFEALSAEPDFEQVLADAPICKAHGDAGGAKGGSHSRNLLIEGRPDHKDPWLCRRARPAGPLHHHARPMGGLPAGKGPDEGRAGARHVMADAAHDADYLRDFIADGLDAPARIKQNPTRTARKMIEWALYRERHLVECFFNRIKRFRRIALRCEKTVLILAVIRLSRLRNGTAFLNEDAG